MLEKSPFPDFSIKTENPRAISVVRALYALTEGTFGRGYRFAMRRTNRFVNDEEVRLIFEDGSQYSFPLSDPYWSRLVSPRFQYEPEIVHVMKWFKDLEYTFIDAGANFGFWSVLASSPAFGNKRAIAIEASADTFAVLDRNCVLNAHRFEIRQNAVFDKDGVELGFSAGHHTERHLTTDEAPEAVRTITLDSLATDINLAGDTPMIIKLDVEGAEATALAGAQRLLKGEVLLVYEDHGNDPTHTITHHIWNELGWTVSYVDRMGRVIQIHDVSELNALKVSKYIGYNFIATRADSTFEKRLASLI